METKQDATHSDICARLAQPCTDGSPNADACAQPQLLVLLTPCSWLPFTPHCQQAENLAFTPSSAQGKGCGCPPCPRTSQPRARTAPLPTVPPSSVLPVLLSGSDSFRHQIPPVRQES